jgi:hypothetical protein
MTGIASLIAVADAYRACCRVPETTVSKRALQDSSRLAELRAGACDIGVKRLARTLHWFSDHWPEGAIWPADVPRPAQTPVSAIGRMSAAPSEASAA